MFGKIAAFELRYQTRQPVFWISSLIFFLLVFGSVVIDQIQIGSGGNIHKNSPQAISTTLLVMSLFFMFVSTAFVANVVVRDDETGYGPIVRATPVSRFDYLFGRFTGAFAATCLAFLAVPLGILVGSWAPWVDPETLGPNQLSHYAFAYFALALPTLLITASLFFCLATVTRSMMGAYLGAAGFLVAYTVFLAMMGAPERRDLAAYLDPLGMSAFAGATRYFTAAEANTLVPPFKGALLYNRLIWTAAGLALLALTYRLFRFEVRGAKARKGAKAAAQAASVEAAAPIATPAEPLPRPRFGLGSAWAQLTKRTRFEMAQVFKSPAFAVLIMLGLFNSCAALILGGERGDAAIYPVTRWSIQTLQGAFSLIPVIVAIYYAGELVWRERDRKTHEIVDATAVPDWAFVVPKTLALVLVLVSTLLISVLAAICVQLGKGFTDLELGRYLAWYVAPMAVDWSLLAVLAIFLQALSPHKFIGWGLMVLYLIAGMTLGNIGFDHNLYLYGGAPQVPLSDMNGQGDFGRAAAWFRAYWSAFAIVLLVLSYGLWRRGTETRLAPRLKRLPRRLFGPAGLIGAAALAAFVGTGAFIFQNTNVWNDYRNSIEGERWLADFEKSFLKYETVAQPSVTDVKLKLDLHPHEPRLVTWGVYGLVNDTGAPVTQLHVRLDRDTRALQLAVGGAHKVQTFDRFNYRIFTFDRPLQPGERTSLTFQTQMAQRGFKNSGNTTRLVDNGTFVNNGEFAPTIGMSRSGLLQDRAKRRKYGLPPQLRMARLEDRSAQSRNYVGDADWVMADITVTTDADQTPVAPGYRVSDTTRDGRRTIRYRTDAPVLHFFSVQSARYAVKRANHQGVELAVYYHPSHTWNVDRMLAAMGHSLDYYQAQFSPFQFRQLRVLEFPDYAQFAQSFANTVPWSEGLGFIMDPRDPDKIDFVTFVTAHEVAHQWWAHQIVGADMQGSTALSETLAEYSAIMVMEKTLGEAQIRRFLKRELDSYLRARGGDVLEEQPLMRVENQQYIHYNKGGHVMYLLRDRMGEARVNAALRRVLAQYEFKGAPYPRSVDLVNALRAEALPEHQQLITDVFERITLHDLKTRTAQVKKRADGRYDVVLTVEAKKMYADGNGKETEVPIAPNERFDVGVFTAEPGRKGFGPEDVLSFGLRPLRSGTQTLTVTVDKPPRFAGIDPYNKLIDRNSDDNAIKTSD
ncbi:ABC transporter permease/M1 family aminopeptidase [Phenylobacterium deserti]|uniref:Aminopeptidase n=1 Tax=Phenylobacterium deserti TaxID=1914756 RepID=A0A328AN72_9CAUL|nr:ABC transporter permease subunit [Phenylobacterium deserti]RAK56443.1 aminopeptidase [Phenylobacterium deserti]